MFTIDDALEQIAQYIQCQPLIETVSGRSLTTSFTTNFPHSDSTNDASLLYNDRK